MVVKLRPLLLHPTLSFLSMTRHCGPASAPLSPPLPLSSAPSLALGRCSEESDTHIQCRSSYFYFRTIFQVISHLFLCAAWRVFLLLVLFCASLNVFFSLPLVFLFNSPRPTQAAATYSSPDVLMCLWAVFWGVFIERIAKFHVYGIIDR